MSTLVDRITAVLKDELDEHGSEDDDEKRWQVAHHWAERIVAEFHLEGTFVTQGETPPLYAISGWFRGSEVQP